MKAKACDDAKEQKVHPAHQFSTEHGERRCKGWFTSRPVRGPRVPRDDNE